MRQDDVVYNNRLDTLLADVFNLLSLFFLTIGKTKEAPATYSQLASMRVGMTSLRNISTFFEAVIRAGLLLNLLPTIHLAFQVTSLCHRHRHQHHSHYDGQHCI